MIYHVLLLSADLHRMHVNVTFESVKIKQLLGFMLRKWLHLEGSGHTVRLPFHSRPAGGSAQGFSYNTADFKKDGRIN